MGDSSGLEAWEVWTGGSETWIVCRRRLGSTCAGDVEANRGVGWRLRAWVDDVEFGDGMTERERGESD